MVVLSVERIIDLERLRRMGFCDGNDDEEGDACGKQTSRRMDDFEEDAMEDGGRGPSHRTSLAQSSSVYDPRLEAEVEAVSEAADIMLLFGDGDRRLLLRFESTLGLLVLRLLGKTSIVD